MSRNDFPTEPVDHLTMHLALTLRMIQTGTSLSMLKQQLITVRDLAKEVLDDEGQPGSTLIQIIQPIPESVAEILAEDVVIPDDPEDLE